MSFGEKLEKTAERCHDSWAGWMQYLFQKGVKNADGTFTINAESVERWIRQMNTKYAELPEKEKESDRIEATHYLSIFYKD